MPNTRYRDDTIRRRETTRWRTRKRAERTKRQRTLSNTWSWLIKTWKWSFSALLVVGTLTGYYILVPRISVSLGNSLDDSKPFATPFEVQNQGILPIYDVHDKYYVNNITGPHGLKIVGNSVDPGTDEANAMPENQFPLLSARLDPGKETTFDATIISTTFMTDPIQTASIKVVVTYQTTWPFGSRTEAFGFRTAREADGRLHWYPDANSAQGDTDVTLPSWMYQQ